MKDFEDKYQKTLEDFQPFVLAPEEVFEDLETGSVDQLVYVDSYSDEGAQLTELLLELDAEAYDGLPMENWVSVDACQETGGILGFGTWNYDNPKISHLDIPEDYSTIAPVSEFSGGFKPDGSFVVNTLSVAEKNQGLGAPTAALATELIPSEDWYAVAQFDNPASKIYSKLGDMTLEEAQVPGHSKPNESFKFKLTPQPDSVEQMLEGETEEEQPDKLVGVEDQTLIKQLQETSENHQILPPGSKEVDGEMKLALTEV